MLMYGIGHCMNTKLLAICVLTAVCVCIFITKLWITFMLLFMSYNMNTSRIIM